MPSALSFVFGFSFALTRTGTGRPVAGTWLHATFGARSQTFSDDRAAARESDLVLRLS